MKAEILSFRAHAVSLRAFARRLHDALDDVRNKSLYGKGISAKARSFKAVT